MAFGVSTLLAFGRFPLLAFYYWRLAFGVSHWRFGV
jgi:hypothetical protein